MLQQQHQQQQHTDRRQSIRTSARIMNSFDRMARFKINVVRGTCVHFLSVRLMSDWWRPVCTAFSIKIRERTTIFNLTHALSINAFFVCVFCCCRSCCRPICRHACILWQIMLHVARLHTATVRLHACCARTHMIKCNMTNANRRHRIWLLRLRRMCSGCLVVSLCLMRRSPPRSFSYSCVDGVCFFEF